MRLEPEHRRRQRTNLFPDQILPDDSDRQTRRPHVLLRTGIEDAEFLDRKRLGKRHRRNVRDQWHIARFGDFREFGAINGVVHADIKIIGLFIKRRRIQLRDIGEGLIGRRSNDMDVFFSQQQTRLRRRFFCPLSGQHIIGLPALYGKV